VLLAAVLLSLWPAFDPALIEPPAFLATEPERVDARFSRCGRGRGHACVVDGDTFKLGKRKVRIIGIDAPEVNGQCEAERQLAERSTARLQALLSQGPFTMAGRIDEARDRYGRDLRFVTRTRADGSTQSIADEMRASGLARRYMGAKASWC
jgi:endonuclease YncB( thermonuclease family)